MLMRQSNVFCATSAHPRKAVVVCRSVPAKTAAPSEASAWWSKAGQAAAAAVLATSLFAGGAVNAMTFDEIQSLSYKEVKGSGLANMCPTLDYEGDMKDMPPGQYKMEMFCMEPTSFQVKQGSRFVPTTLLTRMTYSLSGMNGSFILDPKKGVAMTEEEGMDYAPITVTLPGGETVPFMFSIKGLNAQGQPEAFGGEYDVPSYRGTTFMDPKGRGGSTGYESAIGLQTAQDADELTKENLKNLTPSKGKAVFSISRVDPVTGEVAGVFEAMQVADNDMGAKSPKDVKITGVWYAQLAA